MDDAAATPPATPAPHGTPCRAAARQDFAALLALRLHFLGERARLEGLPGLSAEARARCEERLSAWLRQEDRLLRVAQDAAGRVLGYATGQVVTRPPLWRATRVGDIAELYLEPQARGQGLGRALVSSMHEALRARGAEVLRAAVPVRDEAALARLQAAGYQPWQHVLRRTLAGA